MIFFHQAACQAWFYGAAFALNTILNDTRRAKLVSHHVYINQAFLVHNQREWFYIYYYISLIGPGIQQYMPEYNKKYCGFIED